MRQTLWLASWQSLFEAFFSGEWLVGQLEVSVRVRPPVALAAGGMD